MSLPLLYQQDLETQLNAYANKNILTYAQIIHLFKRNHAAFITDGIINKRYRIHITSEFCQLTCLYMLVCLYGYTKGVLAFTLEGLSDWQVWRGSKDLKPGSRAGTNWGKCSSYAIHALATIADAYVGCILNFGNEALDMEYLQTMLDWHIPVMMRIPKKNFDFENPALHAAHWILVVGYTKTHLIIFDPNKEAIYPKNTGIERKEKLVYVLKSFLFDPKKYQFVYQTIMTKQKYENLINSSIASYIHNAKIEVFDQATYFIGPKI